MIPVQVKDFVVRVLEETEKGYMIWNEGYDDSYFSERNNVTLHISHHFDDMRELNFYGFKIVIGHQVTPFTVTEDEQEYFFMKRLYEAISVNVHNISDSLKGFFD
ncbi:hypothetical protein F7U82_25420 [Vibrio parahaemolyticus]|uniref:hypothetical protein n=1 Tax=Vibrio alginolyticus TaxID=663 RepID=UPI001303D768|nr:hypothetical protein [Vibrio alginolyticus]EGQ9308751.1 hypothetical protein [Vibrio parahaemolyticus]EIO5874540.1 hypothetical protein [Vibrio parahaemolyticus]ELA7521405.1 hypothetical protein [Vibrio parahaemolyticus]ELC0683528.1 hypothetical protein [Vibrio parahaemolyticus]HCE2458132.1 hypothetical protein [Vibrio parahaemolyticus]